APAPSARNRTPLRYTRGKAHPQDLARKRLSPWIRRSIQVHLPLLTPIMFYGSSPTLLLTKYPIDLGMLIEPQPSCQNHLREYKDLCREICPESRSMTTAAAREPQATED